MVEKPVVLTDEEEELKIVPIENNNNNVNIVSDSDSDSSNKDFENNEENFFDEDIDDLVIASPKTTINPKMVWAMKKLQSQNHQGNHTR